MSNWAAGTRKLKTNTFENVAKASWRGAYVSAYQAMADSSVLAPGEVFFTLGGPCNQRDKINPDSELGYLTGLHYKVSNRKVRPFITPRQFVSVERNGEIHASNNRLKGPTWIRGSLKGALTEWVSTKRKPIAVLSADMMVGVKAALKDNTIQSCLHSLQSMFDTGNVPKCGKVLFVLNLVERHRLAENLGARFLPVEKTLTNHPVFRSYRKRLQLVHRASYERKPVGLGARCSTMTTLSYIFS